MRNQTAFGRAMARPAATAQARGLALNIEQIYPVKMNDGRRDRVAAARLVVSHVAGSHKEEDFRTAVASLFDGRVALVDGTVQDVSQPHATQASLYVAMNTQSRPFTQEAVQDFRVVTANVFADPSDNTIWGVRGDGEARTLVQHSSEDLSDILAARRSRFLTTAGFAPSTEFDNGAYAMYFDAATLSPRFGLIYCDTASPLPAVVDRRTGEVRRVNADHVLATAGGLDVDVGLAGHEVTAALDPSAANRMLAYWRKLYGNTTYFVRLEQVIRSRTVMA